MFRLRSAALNMTEGGGFCGDEPPRASAPTGAGVDKGCMQEVNAERSGNLKSKVYDRVEPRSGGPYSLFCYSCRRWLPNTANAEMRKEGVFSHSHFCVNGKNLTPDDGGIDESMTDKEAGV